MPTRSPCYWVRSSLAPLMTLLASWEVPARAEDPPSAVPAPPASPPPAAPVAVSAGELLDRLRRMEERLDQVTKHNATMQQQLDRVTEQNQRLSEENRQLLNARPKPADD